MPRSDSAPRPAHRPAAEPKVWRNIWLVFTAICVVVAALHAFTILAFDESGIQSVRVPILLGIGMPAAVYALGWLVARLRR